MAWWIWLLIDLGIVLLGVIWWALLGLKIVRKGAVLAKVIEPVATDGAKLAKEVETRPEYAMPASALTRRFKDVEGEYWLRQEHKEARAAERQRRLIARLTKAGKDA